VENAGFMRQRETVCHPRQQFDGFPPITALSLQPIPERAAIDKLSDQILATLPLPGIEHCENVRVVE